MNLFFFLVTLLVFSNSALSNEADVIQVASLAVKERIQSIEEINVTAKTLLMACLPATLQSRKFSMKRHYWKS